MMVVFVDWLGSIVDRTEVSPNKVALLAVSEAVRMATSAFLIVITLVAAFKFSENLKSGVSLCSIGCRFLVAD